MKTFTFEHKEWPKGESKDHGRIVVPVGEPNILRLHLDADDMGVMAGLKTFKLRDAVVAGLRALGEAKATAEAAEQALRTKVAEFLTSKGQDPHADHEKLLRRMIELIQLDSRMELAEAMETANEPKFEQIVAEIRRPEASAA